MPAKDTLVRSTSAAYRTPIFLAHSKDDNVIDIQYGKELRDFLTRLEMNAEWHQYDHGGHWLCEPEGVGEYLFLENAVR